MVSILMCTYNREQYLKRAIDSVIAQTYTDWELIIVDDGSTDNTEQFLTPNVLSQSNMIFFICLLLTCKTGKRPFLDLYAHLHSLLNSHICQLRAHALADQRPL